MTMGHVVETQDKINSLSLDFLLHMLYMFLCICVREPLMIWPDVVFARMSHFCCHSEGMNILDYGETLRINRAIVFFARFILGSGYCLQLCCL